MADGTHSLTATASDAAGNVGTSTAVSVTVSNAPSDTTAEIALWPELFGLWHPTGPARISLGTLVWNSSKWGGQPAGVSTHSCVLVVADNEG